MDKNRVVKYRPYQPVQLSDRTWPGNTISRAPIWCSVDLRDGNQALMHPMSLQQKLDMFKLLVEIGFKQIEIGFPASSQVEFDFTRKLIEDELIPDDVVIQVLTQSREELIKRTFEALRGAKTAVVHLYNSTSTLQRRVVFKMSQEQIIALAIRGARLIRKEAEKATADIRYEYSPESFTGTELEFALKICRAVMAEWRATPEKPVIINLPATVEMATPNVYADQIEWFSRNLPERLSAIISLHAHNDRGSAVAATELGLMAGADRVEGTLFGNGERTGNVDLLTLAMNMFSQGIDPELDFSAIDHVVNVYERCTGLDVHPRHPYAGKLVYTAFSGSHQDAINKGMDASTKSVSGLWEVPYLPIDPEDVGRTYESIIRINSQSGKGGVAYIMDKVFGYKLPKEMQPEFGAIIQRLTETSGTELSNEDIFQDFDREYINRITPIEFIGVESTQKEGTVKIKATMKIHGEMIILEDESNRGPLDAFCECIRQRYKTLFSLEEYEEHSLGRTSCANAVSYVGIRYGFLRVFWGVGVDKDISIAGMRAVVSALNRIFCTAE